MIEFFSFPGMTFEDPPTSRAALLLWTTQGYVRQLLQPFDGHPMDEVTYIKVMRRLEEWQRGLFAEHKNAEQYAQEFHIHVTGRIEAGAKTLVVTPVNMFTALFLLQPFGHEFAYEHRGDKQVLLSHPHSPVTVRVDDEGVHLSNGNPD